MNPADEAQVEQAKFNAREAKRQAGLIMGDTTTNALRFNEEAEQKMSEGVAVLGKIGSLGFEKSALPDTGIDVGDTTSGASAEFKQHTADLDMQIADLEKELERLPRGRDDGLRRSRLIGRLQDARRSRKALGSPQDLDVDVPSITGPDSLLYASGSDLLTMTSLRDKMDRDKRSLIRKGQSEAYTMLLAGENYTQQGDKAESAANYNMWSRILGTGLKLAGTAKTFGLFG